MAEQPDQQPVQGPDQQAGQQANEQPVRQPVQQPSPQGGIRQAIHHAVQEAVQRAVLCAVEEAVRSLGQEDLGGQQLGYENYADWYYNNQQYAQQYAGGQYAEGGAGFDQAAVDEVVADPSMEEPLRKNRKTCDRRGCQGCNSADCKRRSLRWHKPGPHWCDGKGWGGKIWGVTRKPSDKDIRHWDMVFDPKLTREETKAIRIAEHFRIPDNASSSRGGEKGSVGGSSSGASKGKAVSRGRPRSQPSESSDNRRRRDDKGTLRSGSWERVSPTEAARRDRMHANVQMSGAAAPGSDASQLRSAAAAPTVLRSTVEDVAAQFDDSYYLDWLAMRRSISNPPSVRGQRTKAADTASDLKDGRKHHDSCNGRHSRRHGRRNS
ncbi:hypothetical protein CMQ_4986 [Grosmannia clavigera kw1407]|uniref:Uncharacterized protein n=1 Tax=Grosmannia clavigera (strain kw1407 / UAMH 11150) TaxID=655863 RepID=F0XK38_GROCL|nr:uncharacterized protein CMQ_4986 [Grosmannia clavigera kw1407]EFX01915.1 hypothetical protein CMQ_4986 [Grosmannia clavigera kw1407]